MRRGTLALPIDPPRCKWWWFLRGKKCILWRFHFFRTTGHLKFGRARPLSHDTCYITGFCRNLRIVHSLLSANSLRSAGEVVFDPCCCCCKHLQNRALRGNVLFPLSRPSNDRTQEHTKEANLETQQIFSRFEGINSSSHIS